MMKQGSLVISLDYELMWGCCEWSTPDGYGRSNVAQVPVVINRMLALFHQYDVHATFATVGMIMLKDKEEAVRMAPEKKPSYHRVEASPYSNNYIQQIKTGHELMSFAPEQVKALDTDPNIEVGTHTYCHYYCWEPGQTIEEFEADMQKAVEAASQLGITLNSIVFPKNQVSDEYLKICVKYGITSYRGNALKYFNEPQSTLEAIKNRICRLLDAYINVGGMTSIPYYKLECKEGMLNVCASRMLRPYSPRLSFLEGLRLRRIKKEMIYAAKKGEMYHLWWHPHNFGTNMEENLRFLEGILQTYKECKERYGMQSCTMTEIKEQLS
jgi:peptidoglycan/xylan/chitin deacetylase (PgdA/CDA1 family)